MTPAVDRVVKELPDRHGTYCEELGIAIERNRLRPRCSSADPSDDMICWPVSPRVGNVKNNDPSLIEPLAAS
jgi:hypothetical protein